MHGHERSRNRGMVRLGRMTSISAFAALVLVGLLATPPASGWHVNYGTRVSDGFASVESNPSIAFGANGQIYVAYSRFDAGNRDIIVRADQDGMGAEGIPVFTSFRVANDAAGVADWGFFDTLPMVVDPVAGSIYVAWVDSRNSATTGTDIRVARSDNEGSSFGASTRVSDFTGLNNEDYPRLAIGPSGTVYAVFIDDRDGAFDVYFSSSADRGATWSPNLKLNDASGGGTQIYPKVAVDSADRVFATWSDFSGNLRVLFDMSADGGATWGIDKVIGNSPAESWIADLVVGRNDIIHIAWQDRRTNDAGVYYTRSLDHGATFLVDGRVNWIGATGDPLPRIATTSDGGVLIIWADGPDVFYTVYRDDGAVFLTMGYVTSGGQSYGLGVDPNGNVFAVWSQLDGGASLEVYTGFSDGGPAAVRGLTAVPGGAPGSAVVTWNANTEPDLAGYEVWRTGPDSAFVMVAYVPAPGRTFTDTGLADGRWTYFVLAVDRNGHQGPSQAASLDIGPTTDDRLDQLQTKVDSLQTQLGDLQTDVTNLQNQNDGLQSDLDDANANLDRLANQIASTQQLNMILLIILIVLGIVSLMFGMRRRKSEPVTAPSYQPPMQAPPPPQ